MGQEQSTQAHAGASIPTVAVSSSCDLELFLIGKTGHGKSSTGNTILGRQRFMTSDMGESATLDTDAGWAERNGLTIKVIDGPGLFDIRLAAEKQLEQMEANLSKGLVHSPNGFHALVLVLSYGQRFTNEEKKTVMVLKRMIGNDFIKDHCVLVFTHGENFSLSNPDGDFKDWCRKQTGDLRQLMDACDNRVVLFHNLTPGKGDESTNQLISMAQKIGKRYTSELFNEIAKERSQFIQQRGAIHLEEPIQSKIDMIIGCEETGETGRKLDGLLDGLEREINKGNFKGKLADDIKRGIQQTREGKKDEGMKSFKLIRDGGKQLLGLLSKATEIIVAAFLKIMLSAWLEHEIF